MNTRRSLLHKMTLAGILILAGCTMSTGPSAKYAPRPDGRYDNHTYFVNPSRMAFSRIAASIVTLVTKTTFVGPNGEEVETNLNGSGVVIGSRYILTVEHTVTQNELQVSTPLGPVTLPVKKTRAKTHIRWQGKDYPLRPLFRSQAEDIALFELPPQVQPPSFPYPLGNSDDLQVGNYVYVVGNPLNMGINVREGIVGALQAPKQIARIRAKWKNAFMVSNGIVPGDSGTPVIAIRDGRFELVGISQGTFRNTRLGWAIRINTIRNLFHTTRAIPSDKWPMPRMVVSSPDNYSTEAGAAGPFSGTAFQGSRLLGNLFSLKPILHSHGVLTKPQKIQKP